MVFFLFSPKLAGAEAFSALCRAAENIHTDTVRECGDVIQTNIPQKVRDTVPDFLHMSTCFFIGHRDAPERVMELLTEAVERHIVQFGVTEFVVGQYGIFDRMAARAVREAKQWHPEVSLVLLLPYYRPEKIDGEWDGTFYPPGMETVPKRLAIVRANRYMVDHCDYLIAYAKYPGNSRDGMEYAKKRGKHIENLAERDLGLPD